MTAAEALVELVRNSRHAVVFTGAGISTESGIPDFRSPGGIWTKMMPMQFQDYVADPASAARFLGEAASRWRKPGRRLSPMTGHRAVAELGGARHRSAMSSPRISTICIRPRGVADEQVIELHGNTRHAKCLDCDTQVEIADFLAHFEAHGDAPDCVVCGRHDQDRHHLVWPSRCRRTKWKRAEAASLAADLFLVVGSSLAVYPAAGFPLLAKRNGAKLVILNREETEQDPYRGSWSYMRK